jgi:hypothetical protein
MAVKRKLPMRSPCRRFDLATSRSKRPTDNTPLGKVYLHGIQAAATHVRFGFDSVSAGDSGLDGGDGAGDTNPVFDCWTRLMAGFGAIYVTHYLTVRTWVLLAVQSRDRAVRGAAWRCRVLKGPDVSAL